MGEIVSTRNTRSSGSSSIQCPLLTDTNYTVWTMHMKVALEVHEVWETIDLGVDKRKKERQYGKISSLPIHT